MALLHNARSSRGNCSIVRTRTVTKLVFFISDISIKASLIGVNHVRKNASLTMNLRSGSASFANQFPPTALSARQPSRDSYFVFLFAALSNYKLDQLLSAPIYLQIFPESAPIDKCCAISQIICFSLCWHFIPNFCFEIKVSLPLVGFKKKKFSPGF